jgi:hypothetical protein
MPDPNTSRQAVSGILNWANWPQRAVQAVQPVWQPISNGIDKAEQFLGVPMGQQPTAPAPTPPPAEMVPAPRRMMPRSK